MTPSSFEIRVCSSCGLRYPISEGNSFGLRCPHCLGITQRRLIENVDNNFKSERNKKFIGNVTLSVLMDNLRSAWNVGSILRSADGFGFSQAFLCGITPTPENTAVAKTALGADVSITWSYHKDSVNLVNALKIQGSKILVVEFNKRSKDIAQFTTTSQNAVLIVGNEITGVDPELQDLADENYYIPMQGKKESFNVAVAFGIAGFVIRGHTGKR